MEGALTGNRRIYSRTGMALFLMLALTAALQFGAQLLASRLGIDIKTGTWSYYAVLLLPQYLIAMPVAAAVIMRIPASQGVGKKKLSYKQFGIIALICFFIMYAGNLAGMIISLIIIVLSGSEMANLTQEMVLNSDMWVNLVVMVLIAPVVEELFFRRLLIGRLKGCGQRAAVAVSAVAFGLAHGNLSQVFYAFGLGLALGYIYIHTGRIGITIALHMAINLMGSVVAPLLMSAGQWAQAAFGMLVLAGVIAGLVQFLKYRKSIRFWDEPYAAVAVSWKREALLNAGMILFFAICACLFALNTWWALQ
jgi:uncharacterized protein